MARVETLPPRIAKPVIRDLRTLTTPNFAVLSALTDVQLNIAENVYQLEAVEAEMRGRMGKRIGARQWLSAIRTERVKRGGR